MKSTTNITHTGAGWYDIRVQGQVGTIARGKANAIAKAEELEQRPAIITATDVGDIYLQFIKEAK